MLALVTMLMCAAQPLLAGELPPLPADPQIAAALKEISRRAFGRISTSW